MSLSNVEFQNINFAFIYNVVLKMEPFQYGCN